MNATNEPGLARSPGIAYQELLDADTHEVPTVLRMEAPKYLGSEDISKERRRHDVGRRNDGQHRLNAVPELPSVGRL